MSEPLPDRAIEKLLASAEPLLEERRIGKYRLVREVGRGGMGVVWEAIDVELRRRVALKVLPRELASDPAVRERFVREARAAASLSHPNVAAVHDATPEAIAMQFVDGVPLSALPRDDWRRLVSLVRDAALAVDYAHSQGLVHRDLKPQNLLVEGDRVVVTDFGLAKAASDPALSQSGSVLGSPSFMAPEQAAGRQQDVDARTDVWGLGATLFDRLAGRPPFVEKDVVALLRKIVEDEPPRVRALAPDVPRDLETVVSKCLAKEKERRYATARALAEDLTRWLDGQAVLAQPPSLRYRASKLVRRHRALVSVGGVALGALLVALGLGLAERSKKRALEATFRLAEHVSSVLADVQTHARLGDMEGRDERLDAGIAECRAFLAEHEVGYAFLMLSRLLTQKGANDEAQAALERALDLDPTIVEARLERGLLAALRLQNARPGLRLDDEATLTEDQRAARRRALEDLDAAESDARSLRAVDVARARGAAALLRGDPATARRQLDEALRLDPLDPGARIALARLDLLDGNGDAAWQMAMSALDLYRGFGPAYLARSAAATTGDASAVDRAVRQHELAAADSRVESGDRSSEALHLRGSARLHIDDVEGALADFSAAVQADPRDAMAHGNRSLVHARRAARLAADGKLDDAIAAWDDAIADATAAITIDGTLAGALNNRGVCRSEKERLLERRERLTDAAAERAAALADFDAAIERAPRFALARLNRAIERRRTAEACVVRLDSAGARAALDAAADDLAKLFELEPNDPAGVVERALEADVRASLATLDGRADDAETWRGRALADFDAAVRLAPSDARAIGLRGVHRLGCGDSEAAVRDLDAALALAPDAASRALFERERKRAAE